MRILHIDPDDMDNPVSGGGPIRTFELCRRLVARGHEVTVLTPTFPGSTPEKTREGVRYVRVGRRIGDHGSSHHITFFLQAPQLLKQFPHDLLVEDFMPPMGPSFTPFFNRRRKPLIASIQWFSAEAWQRQFRLPFVLGQRLLMPTYRHFVVLTEKMRQRVQERLPDANIRVIPNAVPASYFDMLPHYGDFILYAGRVDPRDKGVDLLLKAYALVPPGRRLPLQIVGHGWEADYFERLAETLGVAREVCFLGKLSPAELAEKFRTCRFSCVPSRVETFGLVILEAQAAAKSTVVFDAWPMNEVTPRPGNEIVPAFDVAAYAEAMSRLLALDTVELARRGALNRDFARRFSWDAAAEAQERFYHEVLNQHGGMA